MKYNNTVVKKMNFNGQKVKKWYHNGVKVFSSGNIVTYNVDTGTSYQEEVDSEATVLSPKTFTPTKSGWTFVGWRTDKTASSSVIQSMTMGDDPITLYAVFKRTLTATFSGNGATSGSVSAIYATQYYNNGNYNNPTITLPANGFTRTNYRFTGWSLGAVGAKVTISANTTVNAQWMQTVYNYGYTGGMQSLSVPVTGKYFLQVWGAEGSTFYWDGFHPLISGKPGKGGYGSGYVNLTQGQVIYICVGGSDAYNGGGATFSKGGGATHIGTKNGTLAQYGNTNGLFIVAGGGGGAGGSGDGHPADGGVEGRSFRGGDGGGSAGGGGYAVHYAQGGAGGTQNSGNAFGQGGANWTGGGGGLYGGGGGGYSTDDDDKYTCGGGGGSGYIGGVSDGSWSNGVRSGDGYATITLQ